MVVAIDAAVKDEPLAKITVQNIGRTPRAFSDHNGTRVVLAGRTRELLLPLSQAESLQRFQLASDLTVLRFRITKRTA